MLHNETASLGPTGSPCVRFVSDTKKCASLVACSPMEYFAIAQIQALRTIEIMEETPRGVRSWYKRLFDMVGMQKIVEFCQGTLTSTSMSTYAVRTRNSTITKFS